MEVVEMKHEHLLGVVRLQRECFPEPFPADQLWTEEHLSEHLRIFPAGQFVCLSSEGKVVGSASNCQISEENWLAHSSWNATLGGLCFGNHTINGKWLYGADISVDPNFRRLGIGKLLYRARFELAGKLGLNYGTVCRIPDFAVSGTSLATYVNDVIQEKRTDRTLTPLLKIGLVFSGIIQDYMQDSESGDAGVVLVWKP